MLTVCAAEIAGATTMDAVTTALTTGITSIASGAMDAVGKVIPVALPVMGAIAIVGIGIKIFKKVSGAK